jgi:4a-hydroxytetrahydrobiopterin dehydratase
MTELITADEFMGAGGVADWRVVFGGNWACAYFRTGSFSVGAVLIQAIAELAIAGGYHPDVDLRPDGVFVRLFTGLGGLSARDVVLAGQISAAARELGAAVDPTVVQHVQIAIDALDIPTVRPFWYAVLGYRQVGDEDLVDDLRRGPTIWFQQMDAPRPQRNRMHIDIYVPRDQVQARVAAGLAAGGRLVRDRGPDWWTLADPEGNEADLAAWD